MQSPFRRYECQYLNNSDTLTSAGLSPGQRTPTGGPCRTQIARKKKKATASGHRERMIFSIAFVVTQIVRGKKKATAADTEDTEERILFYSELAADINHAFSA